MKEKLQKIREDAIRQIEESGDLSKLNDVRVAVLGKKGELTAVLKGMKDVAPEERPKVGQLVNDTRAAIEELLEESKAKMEKAIREEKMKAEVIDVIKIQLGEVDSLKRTQGIVQEAISTLKESRETLVSKADVIMKEELISSKNCPLCGASYSDREQLNEKIKEETNVLNKLSDETTTRIQNIKKKIYEEYLEKVEEKIGKFNFG